MTVTPTVNDSQTVTIRTPATAPLPAVTALKTATVKAVRQPISKKQLVTIVKKNTANC